MSGVAEHPVSQKAQPGLTAIGVFLFFGSAMAFLAGTTLTWKGTGLDRIWHLNPVAYQRLAPLGKIVGIPFLFLSALLAITAVGWFKSRLWAWWLTVAVIATQVLGGFGNLLLGQVLEGATAIISSGAILLYLTRPSVRGAFRPIPPSGPAPPRVATPQH
jgi:hypothetical protein